MVFASLSRGVARARRRDFRNGNAVGAADVVAAAEDAVVGSMPRRTRPIFFGRVRARTPNAPSESGRVRARLERARRVARRRRATTPGWRFFPFCSSRRLLFFSRLVNTRSRRNLDCGRDVRSPGRPRARIGRRHARNATGHSPPGDYRRARARAAVAAAAAARRSARDASANSANVSFLAKRFRFFFTNASSDV